MILNSYDLSANLQLGKLLPKQIGLEIPFFLNLSEMMSAPQYDPYDRDILLRDKLSLYKDKRDSINGDAVDYTGIKTINFTNVRFTQKTRQENKTLESVKFLTSAIHSHKPGNTTPSQKTMKLQKRREALDIISTNNPST